MNLTVADEGRLLECRRNSTIDNFISIADDALNEPVNPVTEKKHIPEYCSKNDYISLATYYWPDDSKPYGTPYIRKDGYVNPLGRDDDYYDRGRLDRMAKTVFILSTAYCYTEAEKYRSAAQKHLDAWFVNPQTYMKPHLEYAQQIPGVCIGRDIGIIDTQYLVELIDSVVLIKYENISFFRSWCENYLKWLLKSKNGKSESEKANNHGLWYDAQVMALADFCELKEIVIKTAKRTGERLFKQVASDGSFPLELERTRSYLYSLFALQASAICAKIAGRYSVDLWNARTPAGTYKNCFDFVLPFATGEKKWELTQIDDVPKWKAAICIGFAAEAYNDRRYLECAEKLYYNMNDTSGNLLRYPLPVNVVFDNQKSGV